MKNKLQIKGCPFSALCLARKGKQCKGCFEEYLKYCENLDIQKLYDECVILN